ncbi:hypothetical protein GCM10023189_17800 [Nibrella saemangeumensis]|uniref:Uncharacterized protein n=1 Tax=Nibrella saemangeumensis TaxID=1084526 RepID=A0ABP8MQF0_9BACT
MTGQAGSPLENTYFPIAAGKAKSMPTAAYAVAFSVRIVSRAYRLWRKGSWSQVNK